MGLDIYHCKAIHRRPADINPFNWEEVVMPESEYEGFDVPFSYFREFVQPVDVPETIKTLILPKSENDIQIAEDWLGKYGYTFLFEPDEERIKRKIKCIQKKEGLDNYRIHIWDAPSWRGIAYYRYRQEAGFYIEKLGYQRKGMCEAFTDRFFNKEIWAYTSYEDFIFALNCVDFYWSDEKSVFVEERKRLFKHDFVDKYMEGASYMITSY